MKKHVSEELLKARTLVVGLIDDGEYYRVDVETLDKVRACIDHAAREADPASAVAALLAARSELRCLASLASTGNLDDSEGGACADVHVEAIARHADRCLDEVTCCLAADLDVGHVVEERAYAVMLNYLTTAEMERVLDDDDGEVLLNLAATIHEDAQRAEPKAKPRKKVTALVHVPRVAS